jgi:hypothetical protein
LGFTTLHYQFCGLFCFLTTEHIGLGVDGADAQSLQQHDEPEHQQRVVDTACAAEHEGAAGRLREAQRGAQAPGHREQEPRQAEQRATQCDQGAEHAGAEVTARRPRPR